MNRLFGYIIADLLGLNVRYLILKLIGRPKSRKYLKGNPNNQLSVADQYFANFVTGFLVLGIILGILFKIAN